MLEQSSLALVGEMPARFGEMPARFAAASTKKASNLAIDLTLSPLPDGLEHPVQNAAARRPGGSLWQVCGIVADDEVMVPGNGVHGLNPFFYEKFSFIQLAIAQPKLSPLQTGLICCRATRRK
jgi:hypothetical protein